MQKAHADAPSGASQPGLRVAVYAICKNESNFVPRWMASMAEADGIFVLDTGSEDDTLQRLEALGAQVTQEVISPWRFDVARNRSLALVPEDYDLCVCTDLDEVFHPGWRAAMEKAFQGGVNRLHYRYTWSFTPEGREGVVFWIEKAHARHGFRWVHPVHEVLQCDRPEKTADAPGVQLDHHPDPAKSRGQYLPLLELSVKEAPEDDRNMHYLGREYLFHGRWKACEETLLRHLALPTATWPDERCASMRYLARAVLAQGREQEAQSWLLRACAEAPHLREPWLEAAKLALSRSEPVGALYFAQKALAITHRSRSYINEADSWGPLPYDLAALAAYQLDLYPLALSYGEKALALAPTDERLRDNLTFYQKKGSPW